MDFSACVVTAVCLSISYYLFFPTKIAAAAHATASPSHLVVSLLHIRREAAADWWLHAESREPAALRGGTRREMACSGGKTRTEGREKSEMQLLLVVVAERNSKEGNQIERGVKGSLTVQVIMEYLIIYTDPGSYKGHTMLFSWAISRLSWAQSCCIRAGSGAAPKCKFLFYLAGAPRLVLDHDAA